MLTFQSLPGLFARGSALLVAVAAFAILLPAPVSADDGRVAYFSQGKSGHQVRLVRSTDLVALYYGENRSEAEARRRARTDAEDLGFEVFSQGIGIGQVIVRSTEDSARQAFVGRRSAAETPEVRPVYAINGVESPDTLVVPVGRVVVSFAPEAGIDERAQVTEAFNLTPFLNVFGNTFSYNIPASQDAFAVAGQLQEAYPNLIRSAEPAIDFPARLQWSTALPAGDFDASVQQRRGRDPLVGLQWHLANSGSQFNSTGFVGEDMDIPRFWNPNTRGFPATRGDGRSAGYFGDRPNGTQISVAVFDSGTDLPHENWRTNTADPYHQSIATSVIDGRLGYDYIDLDFLPNASLDAHGTAVAGIIAGARNNAVGMVGIAPSARIYTVRIVGDPIFLPDGSVLQAFASSDLIADGISRSANAQVDIGNHSWGGMIGPFVLEEALDLAYASGRGGRGMAHFASSGNLGINLSYPAAFPSTFSVGGVDDRGEWVRYASFGGNLDFVGPTQQGLPNTGDGGPGGRTGFGIVTMDITGSRGYDQPDPTNPLNPLGNYTFDFNGTSASSPMVAGAAALILSEFPHLTTYPNAPFTDNLFDVMARTADRPDDPERLYIPSQSKAALTTYLSSTDPESTATLNAMFGNPTGFRGNQGYRSADGFSVYFGYGTPNPLKAVYNEASPSPYRDYNPVPPSEEPVEAGFNAGELVLAYQSDFTRDYITLFNSCFETLYGEEEDPDVDFEEIALCIVNLETNWNFSTVQAQLPEPWENLPGLPVTGPQEFHFTLATDDSFGLHEFEFAPPAAIAPDGGAIGGFPFPVLITTSRVSGPSVDESDIWFNPRGRVLRNRNYTLTPNYVSDGDRVPRVPLPESTAGMPLILELTIRYDLATHDVTTRYPDPNDPGIIVPSPMGGPLETLDIFVGNPGQERYFRLTGGSFNDSAMIPIPPIIGFEPEDPGADPARGRRAIWPSAPPTQSYIRENDNPVPVYRTLRFPAGISNGQNLAFRLQYLSSDGYFPEWDFSQSPPTQILDIDQRGHRGYRLADVKVWAVNPAENEDTLLTGEELANPVARKVAADGLLPAVNGSSQEVYYVSRPSDSNVPALVRAGATERLNRLLVTKEELVVRPDPENPGEFIEEIEERPGLDLITRDTVPLFSVLRGEPSRLRAGLDYANVLHLSGDPRSNRLMYVADKEEGKPRIYILTDDGFDERPLFGTNNIGADAEALEAIFSPARERIYFTDGVSIFMANPDGSELEKLFDGFPEDEPEKFTEVSSLTLSADDAILMFSARRGDSPGRGIYYTFPAANVPGAPQFVAPLIKGWNEEINSDWLHPHISPNGRRLVFVSNTIADPLDPTGGPVPPLESPYRLYLIDNIEERLLFDLEAAPRLITAVRDTRSLPSLDENGDDDGNGNDNGNGDQGRRASESYISVLHPQFFNSNGDIALLGYPTAVNPVVNREFGEIATLRLPARVVDPQPTPTPFEPEPTPFPTPTPTPTPPPLERVTMISQYTFDTAGDGWVFSSPDFYTTPINSVSTGSLELRLPGNNINTYGYFRSPLKAVAIMNYPQILEDTFVDENGIEQARPPLSDRIGPHYLVRYYIRRIGADNPNTAPDLRVRVNHFTLQDFHMRVVPPLGTAALTPPQGEPAPVDLLFHPSPHTYQELSTDRFYTMAFDIFSFDESRDPESGYFLDRVEVYRVPPSALTNVGRFLTYTFEDESEFDDWFFEDGSKWGFDPMIPEPIPGRMGMRAPDSHNRISTWTFEFPKTIDVTNVSGKLFIRMTARVGTDETNPFEVPDMQFGVAQGDYNNATISGLVGIKSGRFMPRQNSPRTVRVYLDIPLGTQGDFDFDAFLHGIAVIEHPSFDPEMEIVPKSSESIFLDEVHFDLIRVADYPPVLSNP